ncbi:hypothetical protein [Candidatus Manganitrophus noduliformans]|nr:hypothetical protein [Candidatus Manganitrophus noduliformans]
MQSSIRMISIRGSVWRVGAQFGVRLPPIRIEAKDRIGYTGKINHL